LHLELFEQPPIHFFNGLLGRAILSNPCRKVQQWGKTPDTFPRVVTSAIIRIIGFCTWEEEDQMGNSRVWETILLAVCALATIGCGDSEPVTPGGDDGTPVVVTQMLRFNERAEGLDEDLSGSEAYQRYNEPLLRAAEERGGGLLWSGSTGPLVIGESQVPFHEIVVVEYPSQQVYLEVMGDPRVVDQEAYRQVGLECQWRIPAVTVDETPGEGLPNETVWEGMFEVDDPVPECPPPAALGLYPSLPGLIALLQRPNDTPVVMVNLLRFKEWTEELGEGMTGAEAYALYAEPVLPLVEGYGCNLIWTGRVVASDGETGNGDFHAIALLEYPSDLVFLQVVLDPRMAEITGPRAAGLVGQWLVPATAYD
jgi:uncharacterized protein (DUF1330 family)